MGLRRRGGNALQVQHRHAASSPDSLEHVEFGAESITLVAATRPLLTEDETADAMAPVDTSLTTSARDGEVLELRSCHAQLEGQLEEVTRRESGFRREIDLLQCAYAEMADINAEHESMYEAYHDSMSRKSLELDAFREEIAERDSQLARLQRAMVIREVEAAEHAEILRLALMESEAQRAGEAEEFGVLLAERNSQDQTRT